MSWPRMAMVVQSGIRHSESSIKAPFCKTCKYAGDELVKLIFWTGGLSIALD